jgi:hypothetical protein
MKQGVYRLGLLLPLALAACSGSEDDAGSGDDAGTGGSGNDTGTGGSSSGSSGNNAGGTDGGSSSGKGGSSGSASGSGGSSGGSGGTGGSSGASGSAGSAGQEPIPPRAEPGSCGLEAPAFCDEFETPHPGGRGGDLDEKEWMVARYGHITTQLFVREPVSTLTDVVFPAVFCGEPFENIAIHQDFAFCDGVGADGLLSRQLNEVYNDQGDFAFNSWRIRQPFDFADRDGTIVFDVDAKINPYNIGHGWWVEVFVTEDPAPMPYHESPGVLSFARNGVGFAFQGLNQCETDETLWSTELSRVFVTHDHQIVHDYGGGDFQYDDYNTRCVRSQDQKLNRFKIVMSENAAEIWVSDFDDATTLRRAARVENLDLNFTRGYVHFQHAQYNAYKDGMVTPVQTYRWDNVGFDGPTYPLPRSYEVPDNDEPALEGPGTLYGYYLTDSDWVTVPLEGVDLSNATKAIFSFNLFTGVGRTLQYRFNDGPEHTFTVPQFGTPNSHQLRGFSVDAPLGELVDGDNTVSFKMEAPQEYNQEIVGNMDLSVEYSE